MAAFSILLAPSSEKKVGGNPFAPDMFDYRSSNTFNYFHELNPERRKLIAKLQDAMEAGKRLKQILQLQGEALEKAVDVNLEILDAPLMSALDRYSPGVLYSAMNFQGLPTGAQRRLLENGIIFSGLFGALRPDDLIPNYFLGLDASVPGIGKVANYWRDNMSPILNERLKSKFVWNLLPEAFAGTWSDDHSYSEMVTVRFAVDTKSKRKFVEEGPLAGQLINFIVREALEDMEPVRAWVHPDGFKFDAGGETFDEETRTRQIVFAKRA